MGARRKAKSTAPRRRLLATIELTTSPPTALPAHHAIAKISEIKGTHLYAVQVPPSQAARVSANTTTTTTSAPVANGHIPGPHTDADTNGDTLAATESGEAESLRADEALTLLVELPARFRNTIYMRLGSVVVIDTSSFAARQNKLDGEIENIVRDVKRWRRRPFWPPEFTTSASPLISSGEDGQDEDGASGDDAAASDRSDSDWYYARQRTNVGQLPPTSDDSSSE